MLQKIIIIIYNKTHVNCIPIHYFLQRILLVISDHSVVLSICWCCSDLVVGNKTRVLLKLYNMVVAIKTHMLSFLLDSIF